MLDGDAVLLTFDDGYESNYTQAFPLMRKYRAPGLIFPLMKYFDPWHEGSWSPHLNERQVREMLSSGLVAFGGHTFDGHGTVPAGPDGKNRGPWLATPAWMIMAGRPETEAEYRGRIRADLDRTASMLRKLGVKEERLHFALPNGAYSPEALEELRAAGFRYIYTTDESQVNRAGTALLYRVDAGSPHADVNRLREKLRTLFAR